MAEETNAVDNASTPGSVEEQIEILGGRILSFVLPPLKDMPRYVSSVKAYDIEVFTEPQGGTGNNFRLLFYLDCKILFKDDTSLESSAQSEIRFKKAGEADDKEQFVLTAQETEFIEMALSIGYSTTRGMLMEKSRGTLLEGFVLPVMQASEMMSLPPWKDDTASDESFEGAE